MKKHSLCLHELLTRGIIGILSIILGLVQLSRPIKIIPSIIAIILSVVGIVIIVVQRKMQYDIFDEAAVNHYQKAEKISFRIAMVIISLLVIVFINFNISFEIRASHLMIFSGILHIICTGFFCILEKRGPNELQINHKN